MEKKLSIVSYQYTLYTKNWWVTVPVEYHKYNCTPNPKEKIEASLPSNKLTLDDEDAVLELFKQMKELKEKHFNK